MADMIEVLFGESEAGSKPIPIFGIPCGKSL